VVVDRPVADRIFCIQNGRIALDVAEEPRATERVCLDLLPDSDEFRAQERWQRRKPKMKTSRENRVSLTAKTGPLRCGS
jgi:hypothetical protein